MNPNYGYQLYQVQRPRTRAEMMTQDARRGRLAAAFSRRSRKLAGKASKRIALPRQLIQEVP
jgi:hypothetical protein